MTEDTRVHIGSGNVFADLGLPNPEERLVKAELASKIGSAIEQKKLTQIEAAELLGIDQPKVSALTRGKLSGFSTARLLRFLNALGNDVEIVVKPKPEDRSEAKITVVGN
ncbi:XRE family transcriptional regulator [Waterburya agarophytonicola K14]|uniref:XRE family transcriptional regulator n=1 Tax=Waterburya agarophytonicola KI4 TaxID=2874699 RepID=A0A964BX24_9CYAN|nr:helix-turn-helix transcriptional regulator [Waterburya agarophytonicola]MCC0179252.1 XRE family transcriptional regulator [Waterburya agarophytonicola KI4]